jgi:hypothetical protein
MGLHSNLLALERMMVIKFSGHAIKQMFQRAIRRAEVAEVVENGQIIDEYPTDKPWPSKLLLGFPAGRALHVVFAHDLKTDVGIVVTAYVPQTDVWTDEYLKRRE